MYSKFLLGTTIPGFWVEPAALALLVLPCLCAYALVTMTTVGGAGLDTPAAVASLRLLSVLPILFLLGADQSLKALLVVTAVTCVVACEGGSPATADSWVVLPSDPCFPASPKVPYCEALRRGAVSALLGAHLFYQRL